MKTTLLSGLLQERLNQRHHLFVLCFCSYFIYHNAYLNCRAINFIIVIVGTYKADVHRTFIKMYHRCEPVLIAFDIKYIPVISHSIHAIKGLFMSVKFFQSALRVISCQLFNGSATSG
jgi:hypothetical protein